MIFKGSEFYLIDYNNKSNEINKDEKNE